MNEISSHSITSHTNQFPDFSQQGYLVEQELGHNLEGGRVTYKAICLQTQQKVVIKQFQFARVGSSWSGYEALQQEIALLQQLQHPRIPKYLATFETDCGFCLVQEYIDARSLAEPQHFTIESVQLIAIAILEVLVYLQKQLPPIIHRDIKPENILVDEQLNVYLVDFGLARIGIENLSASSTVKGTLGFMPPEVLFGRSLTLASDLYSLGMTLVCLLTQTKSTQVGELIDDNFRVNLNSLVPQVNSRLVSWLEKMVAPSPQERFPNANTALCLLKSINFIEPVRPSIGFNTARVILEGLSLLSAIAILSFSHKAAVEPAAIHPEIMNIPTIENPNDIRHLRQFRDCTACNLRGADLRGMDLRSTELRNADLTGADLRGADLRGAHLMGADLTAARLEGANLASADLTGATMPNGLSWEIWEDLPQTQF
ncbi:protein kinase [Scytonema sp. UIC 10036]|uniref:serine/threonine protein kinase n=1 Tax=Scytonema sp. UIC 10036 TaxID=2304196 RepID=UPI0012DAA88E|nr:serine/threonine-protein kinase [Scytonema sp. UIC 10036]MUG99833.1 protein kinase [Scytonema sp. UIC 10036]